MTPLDDRVVPRERFTRCHQQLSAHQIQSGDLLGDRMFDLEPRVHLEKVERRSIAAARREIDEELDGAGVSIIGGACRIDRRRGHALAQRRCHNG